MAVQAHRLWYIRNLDLFRNLDEAALDELARKGHLVQYKRGDGICAAGTGNDLAYVIKEGNVRLMLQAPNGRRLTVAILKPGDVVGGTGLFVDEADGESAEAMSQATLFAVPVETLRQFARERPDFAIRVTKEVNKQRTFIMNRMQDVLFLTVQQRLARLLLRLADEFPGTATSGKRFVNIRLTHQELADLVGANREAVSTALIKLRKEKCLAAIHGYFVLSNEESLRQTAYAQPEASIVTSQGSKIR